MELETIDCVSEMSNGMYGKIQEIVLDETKIEERYLFAIEVEKHIYWVASL